MIVIREVCQKLESQGVIPGRTTTQAMLKVAVTNLYGDIFDRQLLEELLDECAYGSSQDRINVEMFAHKVVAAQQILLQGIEINKKALLQLEKQKKGLQTKIDEKPKSQISARQDLLQQICSIDNEMEQKRREMLQYSSQLETLQCTFGNRPKMRPSQFNFKINTSHQDSSLFQTYEQGDHRLLVILVLSLILFTISLLTSFGQVQNLNLISSVALLSIFAFNFFDSLFVRYCLIALAVSLITDTLWLVLCAVHWWQAINPLFYSGRNLLYRGCVIGVGVEMVLKVGIVGLLWGFRGIERQGRWMIPLCNKMSLVLGGSSMFVEHAKG